MNKLEHVAIIDFCYWKLNKLNEQLSKRKSNIEILVDIACGYNENGRSKKGVYFPFGANYRKQESYRCGLFGR